MAEAFNSLFLWFYCLPLFDALLITAGLSVLFLILDNCISAFKWHKGLIALMLLTWAGLILITTLNRSKEISQEPCWIPFYSYYLVTHGGNVEIYRANLMNVILFYPLGLFSGKLRPKYCGSRVWTAAMLLVFVAMSTSIEWVQYRYSLGYCEVDDVLHNGLGVFLGLLVSLALFQRKK